MEILEMTPQEKAKIVAFARLLNVEGSDDEIIQRYLDAQSKAYDTFSAQPAKIAKAEVGKKTW